MTIQQQPSKLNQPTISNKPLRQELKMTTTKQNISIIPVIAVTLFSVTQLFAQQGMPAPTVGTVAATERNYNPTRNYNGRITSPDIVSVIPQVSGTIVEVAFKEGSMVKKGDLLYRIDDVKYNAAVSSAKAAEAQAQATLDYAQKTFERTQKLFEKKVCSVDDFDAATSKLSAAKAALDAAKASLISAEDNLRHCRIVSPIDGKIGVNAATVGNFVSTATGPLTTIVGQNPLRLSFSMSSRDFLGTYGGEKGLRDRFKIAIRLADDSIYSHLGEIDFISNTANPSTDTITIYVKFANPDGLLVPGASVKVEVSYKEDKTVVTVPVTTIIHNLDGNFLYVIGENNMPEKRTVVTDGVTETYEIISSGLKAGEVVIAQGTHKVIPGTPVNPVAVEIN